MEIVRVDIASLRKDGDNARSHSDDSVSALMGTLSAFGQYSPLVVRRSDNTVLAGNGTLEAMRRLGWMEADVVFVDLDTKMSDILSVIDNRSSETSFFDSAEIERIFYETDSSLLKECGFSDDDIKKAMNRLDAGSTDDATEKANEPDCECPYCHFKFRSR